MQLFYFLYIDPGIGSLVAQAVLAGIIAGWVFFKNSIRRVFFRAKKADSENTNEEQKN